jgi:hypothetical protein
MVAQNELTITQNKKEGFKAFFFSLRYEDYTC